MKMISSITKYSWVLVAVPLAFSSCSKDTLDNINAERNKPLDVDAKFILTDVVTRTAFSNAAGDVNTYVATYIEHEVGVHNQMYYSEMRITQPTSASTFNNSWGSIYTSLKDAKKIISKCSPGGGKEENNNTLRGIGEVMAAYNLALLTDLYGDAPWTESGDYLLTLTPKVDKQQAIYTDIMAYIDKAIVDLKLTGTSPGVNDFLYGGTASSWLKFAYGLKARYTMRLIKNSTALTADLQKVIDNVNLSFVSADEQAAFSKYDANNWNPSFDYQWSRDGLGASRSLVDKLIARNDPRLRREFVRPNYTQIATVATGDAVYNKMAPNGLNEQIQYFYNTSIFTYSQTAPTLLLSYHELQFLKAEAMARLGNSAATVAPVLKAAVVAAIANTEVSVAAAFSAPTVIAAGAGLKTPTAAITPAEAGTYFDTNVLPLLNANPISEIMNQKYLAFFGASGESTEAYNDIRRLRGLGQNVIQLANTKPFPLRLPYGSDDTTTNPNVQSVYGDGQYVYSEPVWWAGGTR